jgi:hypothetical protein
VRKCDISGSSNKYDTPYPLATGYKVRRRRVAKLNFTLTMIL